jgi:hypothetical protein
MAGGEGGGDGMIVFIEGRDKGDGDSHHFDDYKVNVNGVVYFIPVAPTELDSEDTRMRVKNRAIGQYKKAHPEVER